MQKRCQEKLIIMLGDYVDRGPASAQVVDHLIESCPESFERLCLTGNHDMAMLDYLDGRLALSTWLQMGGEATLLSYGIDIEHLKLIYKSRRRLDEIIRAAIPERHTQFLRTLPILIAAGNFRIRARRYKAVAERLGAKRRRSCLHPQCVF